jgi:ATPase subunit of ABC transporter with duplicated ATPase domains
MPATLLDARRISRRYGDRTVLDGVDLRVDAGSRIGLVGPNGSGKSTLLRIMAGCEPADGGVVRRFAGVGYLPQMADAARPSRTVRETILDRIGVAAADRDVQHWSAALAGGDLAAVDPHAAALDRWLALGGADVEARLGVALGELGLKAGCLDRPLRSLSGGQASRAGLAALTVARCDVVLLDEPTNHLDADGLERLAGLLAAGTGGIVLVSHDRAFLAETAHEIVALDRRTGEASHWRGGWDAYERERDTERQRARAEHDHALERRAKLAAAEQETRRRAAASLRRTRTHAHDNDKHLREWVTMRAEGMTARARKMGGRAERIEVPDAPWADPALRLALTPAERRRTWVVSLAGAVMRRGDWSLGPLDLAVAYGERLRLRGPNASGKSTVLRPREPRWPPSGSPLGSPAAAARRYPQASALEPSSPSSRSSAPPACCSTSRRTTSTSSHSRCSRQRWTAGRARSSSRLMIVAWPRPCGWTGRSSCDGRCGRGNGCRVTMGA